MLTAFGQSICSVGTTPFSPLSFQATKQRQILAQREAPLPYVGFTLKTLHGPMGGVVKAAFKRGQIDDAYQHDLKNYRAIVTKHALVLLKPKAGHTLRSDRRVRTAVQMMHAVAIDTLHHDGGALKRGRKRTAHALSTMMLSYLDLPLGNLETDRTIYGADELIDIPNEFGPSVATAGDLKSRLDKSRGKKQ